MRSSKPYKVVVSISGKNGRAASSLEPHIHLHLLSAGHWGQQLGLLLPPELEEPTPMGEGAEVGALSSSPSSTRPRSAPGGDGSSRGTPKKTKVEPYSLTTQQSSLIKEDKSNMKLWTEILKSLKDGPVSSPAWPGPLLFTIIRWR